MMTRFRNADRAASAAAVAVVLSALAFAGPARAASGVNPDQAAPAQEQAAPQATPAPTPTKRPPTRRAATDRVEHWIASLHDELHITPAQTPQWDAVAQVMRENAQSVHRLIQERSSHQGTPDAIADLRSYEQIADAHADGIKRLLPPFQTLYADMSDQQKKNADMVFSSFEHPRAHKRNPA
jgi:protein CpxP